MWEVGEEEEAGEGNVKGIRRSVLYNIIICINWNSTIPWESFSFCTLIYF
jgi:hypothetical protein